MKLIYKSLKETKYMIFKLKKKKKIETWQKYKVKYLMIMFGKILMVKQFPMVNV